MKHNTKAIKKPVPQFILGILITIFIILLSACSSGGGGGGSPSATDEGSVASPITVTVANEYGAMVGPWGVSYYQFMAISDMQYTVSLTNTASDLSWTLYSNSSFTSVITDCDNSFSPVDEVCSTGVSLAANTMYYLSVDEWDNVAGAFTILVSEGP